MLWFWILLIVRSLLLTFAIYETMTFRAMVEKHYGTTSERMSLEAIGGALAWATFWALGEIP